jgi:hypothetical protein
MHIRLARETLELPRALIQGVLRGTQLLNDLSARNGREPRLEIFDETLFLGNDNVALDDLLRLANQPFLQGVETRD